MTTSALPDRAECSVSIVSAASLPLIAAGLLSTTTGRNFLMMLELGSTSSFVVNS